MGGWLSSRASAGAGLAWIGATAFLSAVLLIAFLLPASAGAQTTREGILQETIAENLARQESITTYSLRSGGTEIPVLPTAPVSATTGDRVVVSGAMHDGKLVGSVTPDEASTAEPGPTSAIGPTGPIFSGPRKVAVLLVKFADDPAVPWSPDVTREKVFTGTASADVFFQEESRGVISLAGKANPEEGDVFGWFTVNSSGSGCSQNTWANEALVRASEAGISLTGYNHIVYAYTHRSGCFWNGMATLGGNSGSVHLNGDVSLRTIAHELGHNFSFYHAGSMSCTRGGVSVQISESCSVNPYGDPFDAMGNIAARHNNGWNLAKIGMLAAANVVTVTEDGNYASRAALSLDPAPTILRIPRTTDQAGSATSWYYLEVRQQGGVFENVDDASMHGVSIRVAPITEFAGTGFETETLLIDANPSTPTFADAPLQVGNTFYDGKVRIKTLTAGGGAASVSVELDVPDEEPPSAPSNLTASLGVSGVKLKWDASTDNVGVSRYAVSRDGSEIGTSPTASFTDTSPTPGQHAYAVYAEDEAGNRSAAAAVTFVVVDAVNAPPADHVGSRDSREGPSLVKPALRWHRRPNGTFAVEVNATRNPGVERVRLWLDGELLRSRKGPVLRLVWDPRTARCARAHRFVASAYESTDAGRVVAMTRVRAIRFPKLVGKCRG